MDTKPILTAIGEGHRWRHRAVTLGLMTVFGWNPLLWPPIIALDSFFRATEVIWDKTTGTGPFGDPSESPDVG